VQQLLRYLGLAPDGSLLGNPWLDWGYALALGLASFVSLLVLRHQLLLRARRMTGRELPSGVRLFLALVARTRVLPLFAVSLLAGSKYLDLGTRAERLTTAIMVVLITLQIGAWISAAVRFSLEEHYKASDDRNSQTMVTIVQFVASVAIWSMVVLIALDNLGFQVKALLTGLGIGGIAVALAVQSVLGDLLASVSIATDHTFGVGDALVLDSGYAGTVEAIGIRSTRLRSVSGEQIVLANADLVKARIRNYGRLRERRSVFRIGIQHGTAAADLALVPGILKSAISAQELARFERAHLVGFSNTSIDFEAVYSVAGADYISFLDTQQALNLALARALEERGIGFASLTPLHVALHAEATRQSAG
jgi:small-conductance mechanosensitive channel